MIKAFIGIFLVVVFFNATIPALAAVSSSDTAKTEQQIVLLQQIKLLLQEVQRLQSLLKEKSDELSDLSRQPYQSVFFDRSYEAIYFVNGGMLRPVTHSDFIRPVDYKLFNLLKAVIGEGVVNHKVSEWRVFNDDVEDLGGFVELIVGTDDWIFGVNRAQYETNDLNSTRSFANLFIHEYAHLLLYNQPEFTQKYTNQFWTNSDQRHQAYVAHVGEEKRFSVLTQYFEANSDRFVSDYATLSPDEDLAETFVTFVHEERGRGTTLREEKINAFYSLPEFVSIRNTLRNNLKKLGVLD